MMARHLFALVILLGLLIGGSAVADMKGGREAILKGQFAKAFKEFKEDAEKGVPHAMAPVAVMLHMGQGVKQDLSKAFYWYRKAAESGYDSGVANVGIMYYKGAGTSQDDVQAYAWLDTAGHIRGGREHNAKARVASFLSAKQLEKAEQLAKEYRQLYAAK